MTSFNLDKTFGEYCRSGVLKTRRGDVLTPTFMPDGTKGVVKNLLPEEVKSTGIEVILANTYHLHLQPGEKVIKDLGGLHAFGGWQGPILTDSGGFQVFSLSRLRKITEEGVTFQSPVTGEMRLLTPEKSMQIQLDLGSDMIVAFDHLTGLDEKSIKHTREAYDRTHRWLERCIVEFKKLTKGMKANERPLLFGVVQGGLDLELRAKSLKVIQDSGVDGIAIGGLSVGEPREEMKKVLKHLAPLYDPERPHFLLGVGTPTDLRFAYEHGIDMADCVLPTRNARHATVWIHKPCTCGLKPGRARLATASRPISAVSPLRSSLTVTGVQLAKGSQGTDETRLECKACGDRGFIDETIHLTNAKYTEDPGPIMEDCDCMACTSGYSRAFLRHQFKVGDPLAGSLASIHNLRYLQRIAASYR